MPLNPLSTVTPPRYRRARYANGRPKSKIRLRVEALAVGEVLLVEHDGPAAQHVAAEFNRHLKPKRFTGRRVDNGYRVTRVI